MAAFVRISKSTRDDQKINFIIKLLSIKFFCIRIGSYALKRHISMPKDLTNITTTVESQNRFYQNTYLVNSVNRS